VIKKSFHLMITVQKHAKIFYQSRWPSQNTFRMWTVLYLIRSSRTEFGVSISVWRLAGNIFNITCNFLYCNHQVYRDFMITLYNITLFYSTIIILWDQRLISGPSLTETSLCGAYPYLRIECVDRNAVTAYAAVNLLKPRGFFTYHQV
jgi:hypothetical protein